MDNPQNFSLIDTDCIPQRDTEPEHIEWFEDATSDADWFENISGTAESTACSLADGNLLDELYEKNRILEKQLTEMDIKYQTLMIENQRLNVQLSNEKHRATKYHKKLQYIFDNHHILSHLKQTYLNMKYTQNTADRPLVEIREKACQTWQGILCESCIATAEMKQQMELEKLCAFTANEPDTVTVKKADLAKMQETLLLLKERIGDREKSWGINAAREETYKNNIKKLQTTVVNLNEVIADRNNVIEASRWTDGNLDTVQRENAFLKRIIVKLEQRQRNLEKIYKSERRPSPLTQHERHVVQQLLKKYAHRLELKGKKDAASSFSAAVQNSSLMGLVELDNYLSNTEAGEGCSSGASMFPSMQPHSNPHGDFKEQAEKPLSTKSTEVDLIDFTDHFVNKQ